MDSSLPIAIDTCETHNLNLLYTLRFIADIAKQRDLVQ
jgi:hypothetical protein